MFQIHQFLNVGVQIEKNFATSQQIGELVVVVQVEQQILVEHIVDEMVALELKLLDDIDDVQIVLQLDARPFDWIDDTVQDDVMSFIEVDEVVVVDEVEDTETVETDEPLENHTTTLEQDDETDEILDCIEDDENDDFDELFVKNQTLDVDEIDETDTIDEDEQIEEVNDTLDVDDFEL